MATLSQTILFTFVGNQQNFVSHPGTSATLTWINTDGNPSGCLSNALTNVKNGTAPNSWTLATTWEALGVIPGSTITGVVSGSLGYKCSVFSTASATLNHSGTATVVDGVNTITVAAQSAAITAVTAWLSTAGVDSTGLSLASTNTVTITINSVTATGSSTTAKCTILQDQLQFTIQFTPPTMNYKSGGAGMGYNSSLLGRWPLNEGAGTKAYDKTTGDRKATILGTPTRQTLQKFGKTVLFDSGGTSALDFSDAPWDAYTSNISFSVCLWHYILASETQFFSTINKSDGTAGIGSWNLGVNHANGYGYAAISDLGGTQVLAAWDSTQPGNTFTDNQWHFVVGVFDRLAQLVKISVDGFPFVTASISSIGSAASSPKDMQAMVAVAGYLHDIRFYSRPLALSEANAIYRAGLATPTVNKRNRLRNQVVQARVPYKAKPRSIVRNHVIVRG